MQRSRTSLGFADPQSRTFMLFTPEGREAGEKLIRRMSAMNKSWEASSKAQQEEKPSSPDENEFLGPCRLCGDTKGPWLSAMADVQKANLILPTIPQILKQKSKKKKKIRFSDLIDLL